jgi:hypothetical protein
MKLNIEITREDYFNFNKHHFIRTRLKGTVLTCLIGLITLQFFIYRNKSSLNINAAIVSSFIYLVLYFLFTYLSLTRTSRIPQENGGWLGSKEFNFSNECISYKDKNSEGQYNWSAIKKLEEGNTAFYLYIDSIMAILIPKRYFNGKPEELEFGEYVRNKLSFNSNS